MGVVVTAYSPLGAPGFPMRPPGQEDKNILKDEVITAIAAKHEKSVGQVILNWHLQRGHIMIPKSSNASRMEENFNCFKFTLTSEEVEQINALDLKLRIFDPFNWSPAETWDNIPYFC
jgi:diketogulonate reductase-like aldo/keto reductase